MTYGATQAGMASGEPLATGTARTTLPEGLDERFAFALALRFPPRRASHPRTRRNARAQRNGRWR